VADLWSHRTDLLCASIGPQASLPAFSPVRDLPPGIAPMVDINFINN